MELIINGEIKTFSDSDNLNIQRILDHLKIESKVVAVALNSLVVKKNDWSNTFPKNGDKIEFLQFMGGGQSVKIY
ncbi:sulfur carrier protein ThiS [Helicobacter sp. 13S00477-4]|uniref:sulfur carrier protein ThiS n=1 Tax=Helicobacter sp. 13S00477-4 TaxID=1905759 RepID=UPI000BA69EBC|nr:sulfur carrier protein ThiS [Helicobacter sp. 13S00477-4]PAF52234.1 thiamine biosynthesis protein ThiS [Helicobacter sp. 13S00477-4]